MWIVYRHIGAWGRRYGCARCLRPATGTNHYFIFHFVYFSSGRYPGPKGETYPRGTKTRASFKTSPFPPIYTFHQIF